MLGALLLSYGHIDVAGALANCLYRTIVIVNNIWGGSGDIFIGLRFIKKVLSNSTVVKQESVVSLSDEASCVGILNKSDIFYSLWREFDASFEENGKVHLAKSITSEIWGLQRSQTHSFGPLKDELQDPDNESLPHLRNDIGNYKHHVNSQIVKSAFKDLGYQFEDNLNIKIHNFMQHIISRNAVILAGQTMTGKSTLSSVSKTHSHQNKTL
jgi:hypothetical protein